MHQRYQEKDDDAGNRVEMHWLKNFKAQSWSHKHGQYPNSDGHFGLIVREFNEWRIWEDCVDSTIFVYVKRLHESFSDLLHREGPRHASFTVIADGADLDAPSDDRLSRFGHLFDVWSS